MPDRLTGAGPAVTEQPARGWAVTAALQLALALAAFAVAGAGAGWLWWHLWGPPATGTVSQHVWFTDEPGLRQEFSGTGLFIVISAGVGLVVGAVVSWLLARAELVTLLAVLGGSALAVRLMLLVGAHLSPPDPQTLARAAADGTKLPGHLFVSSGGPYAVLPAAALLALAGVFLLVPRPARLASRPPRRGRSGRVAPDAQETTVETRGDG